MEALQKMDTIRSTMNSTRVPLNDEIEDEYSRGSIKHTELFFALGSKNHYYYLQP
jgi:hypothetical protein